MEISLKIDKTVEWIQAMGKAAKVNGMLVGVSGGIDSAVVACLIKRAYPEHSMGVILPIQSNISDLEDAERSIQSSGIQRAYIDLTEDHSNILKKVRSAIGELYSHPNARMTDANLRARLRMSTLYSIANNLNYMVVGTDNAAEILTGYYTKYGDGGVDILPIANLLKSEVYEWAKVLGVPDTIIKKAPSAGLWEGQTDEAEMGVSYHYIDEYLKGNEIPQKEKDIIERLHQVTAHKRNLPPKPPIF
ncbi:MAG: NAD(+) synthase [Peptostreptococcaceae bacterium]|nr:NAD(+) synthase [Peptostreptococcaceae bacterium]